MAAKVRKGIIAGLLAAIALTGVGAIAYQAGSHHRESVVAVPSGSESGTEGAAASAWPSPETSSPPTVAPSTPPTPPRAVPP